MKRYYLFNETRNALEGKTMRNITEERTMYAQLSDNYRKIGKSLYQRQGNALIHVAVCPPRIRSLEAAIRWFLSQDNDE